MKTLNSPAGQLKLVRYPFAGDPSHQAWDSADEWILGRFPSAEDRILITGEAFGVLAAAWQSEGTAVFSDSVLSLMAMDENLRLNAGGESVRRPAVITPADTNINVPEPMDRIFIRIPRSLDLLEYYIRSSLRFAGNQTEIWLGGMDKLWSGGVKKITDRLLKTEDVFPFARHSRWIRFSIRQEPLPASPACEIWHLEGLGLEFHPVPGVFSGSRLDGGTAALLEAYPEKAARKAERIIDAGCGSGILGLAAAAINPEADLVFTDESFLAVSSAEQNYRRNFGSRPGGASFRAVNGISCEEDNSADLVLCNPPFHYKNIQSPEPAEFLFSEAARVLKTGGELRAVGNSHLGYHRMLEKIFGRCRTVKRGKRFTVLSATVQ